MAIKKLISAFYILLKKMFLIEARKLCDSLLLLFINNSYYSSNYDIV